MSPALIAVVVAALLAAVLYLWMLRHRPPDCTGNGITIGLPKVFDSRSLSLKIEQLNAGLETLRVVNQNVTENLPKFQERSASESTLGGKVSAGATPDTKKEAAGGSTPNSGDGAKAAAAEPAIGVSASDALNDQLNLASQIVNLRTLYERSLSDRLLNDKPRLQAVLGFQVSINPPLGCENCVAVTEVAVRVKGKPDLVSLVALMPQEKTYNSETISTSSRSFEGSTIAKVITLGLSAGKRAERLYLHRDSDTLAFERDPSTAPCLFHSAGTPEPATVFGWEFRPVLGRRAVSAGTRQMLAVVALPETDQETAAAVTLEIRTRSYWRRYSRRKQTTGALWRLPLRRDPSRRFDSGILEVAVPNTARIQESLAPTSERIQWVQTGPNRATVMVGGSNFFPGTQVLIGGDVYSEAAGNLVLKSDQALEINTTLSALSSGDGVISGRFGSSVRLQIPQQNVKFAGLDLLKAFIKVNRAKKYVRVVVYVAALGDDGEYKDLSVDDFTPFPDAVLLVGTEPLPLPYDYTDVSAGHPDNPIEGTKRNCVRIEGWTSAATFAAADQIVTFRVPFCGVNWSSSVPLSLSQPTVARVGGGDQTVLHIAQSGPFATSTSIELDKVYAGIPELTVNGSDIRFTVDTKTLARFPNLVLRQGTFAHLLPIPPAPPEPKPAFDGKAPPRVEKGKTSPVEWSGTALQELSKVTLGAVNLEFCVYDGGTRMVAIVPAPSGGGKIELECETKSGEKLKAVLLVI